MSQPLILINPAVTVAGQDVSGCCTKATIQLGSNTIDTTPLGAPVQESAQGAATHSVSIDVLQDDAGTIDTLFWPYALSGAPFPVTIKRVNAAASSSNPIYGMTGILTGYTPLDASPGATTTASIPIVCADPAGITRGTA